MKNSKERKSVMPRRSDGKVKAKTYQKQQALKKAITNLVARVDELEDEEVDDEEEYYEAQNKDEDESNVFIGVVEVVQ